MGWVTCAVEGCEKPAKNRRGWCSAHYARWLRNGDPGPPGDARRRPRPFVACSVEGCEHRSHAHGMCAVHYARWKRTGSTERTRRSGFNIAANGYIRVWAPGHPMADAQGLAYQHRKVWFDAHGPIPDGHHVHHINSDKTDNRIENLELISASEHALRHMAENGYVRNQFGEWPVRAGESL